MSFLIFNKGKKYVGISLIAILGIVFISVGQKEISHAEWESWKTYPILESCSRNDEEYKNFYFNTEDFEDWPDSYHDMVDDVIDEYINPEPDEAIECIDGELMPLGADSKLLEMAEMLPPWQDSDDLDKLDRNDIGIVLLEFLRVYECALVEHSFFLPIDIAQEHFDELALAPDPSVIADLLFGDLVSEIAFHSDIISKEIATARPTLERALAIVSSLTRLGPLSAELECLQRASLDLRNGMGLAADASVCLPKGWDAKDPLRDL